MNSYGVLWSPFPGGFLQGEWTGKILARFFYDQVELPSSSVTPYGIGIPVHLFSFPRKIDQLVHFWPIDDSWRRIGHYLFPLRGVVIPIVNLDSSESDYKKRNGYQLLSIGDCFSKDLLHLPTVFVCFNLPDATLFADFNDPNWWWEIRAKELMLPEQSWKILQELAATKSLPVIEHPVGELNTLFPKLEAHFALTSQSILPSQPLRNRLPIPSLPGASVRYGSIGVGTEASVRFIMDCLAALIRQNIVFKIWVEAMSKPPRCSFEDFYSIMHDEKYVLRWDTSIGLARPYHVREDMIEQSNRRAMDALIRLGTASSVDDGQAKVNSLLDHAASSEQLRDIPDEVAAAYHVYLEYQGMVHDGIVAFNEPIPLAEYQSKLSSTWRRSFEVKPSMTIAEAEVALAELVRQAKFQPD